MSGQQIPVQAETETVAATTTAQTVNGGNGFGCSITNVSGQIAYVLFGEGTATASLHTKALADNAEYDVPFGFAGNMSILLAAGSGNVILTKFK